MTRRTDRISHTMQRELGALITEELRDPRLPKVTSVTKIVCSSDLQEARVSVSTLGAKAEQQNAIAALQSAAGFLRRELGDRIRMKQVPRLIFEIDTAIGDAAEMLALMDSISAADRKRASTSKPG